MYQATNTHSLGQQMTSGHMSPETMVSTSGLQLDVNVNICSSIILLEADQSWIICVFAL